MGCSRLPVRGTGLWTSWSCSKVAWKRVVLERMKGCQSKRSVCPVLSYSARVLAGIRVLGV